MCAQVKPLQPTNAQPINTLDISPSGELLVLGQQSDSLGNAYLTLWNLEDLTLLSEIEGGALGFVSVARFSPDDRTLAYVKNSSVYLYSLATQETDKLDLHDPYVKWLAYDSRQNRLVTAGFFTQIWDVNRQEVIWTLQDPRLSPADRRDRSAIAALDADGRQVAVAAPDTGRIVIYDVDQDRIVQGLEGNPSQVRWVSFDPYGTYLAAIERYSHGFFLWDLRNGQKHLPHIFNSKAEDYWSLSFHPDGEHLALGMLSGYIIIVRLADGESVVEQSVHEGRVWDLAFTPDGRHLVSGGDDGIAYIWELD